MSRVPPARHTTSPRRRVPRREPPSPHVGLGAVVLGIGASLAAAALTGRAARAGSSRAYRTGRKQRALRRSRDGAALLSLSAMTDSTLEHYRGGFHHSSMYAAPVTGALSLAASLAEPRPGSGGRAVLSFHGASLAVGLAGLGFHLRNVLRRDGGLSWNNLFYGAPIGAPGALLMSGLIGTVTHAMGTSRRGDFRHGRQLAALSGVALLGETAEVWLLHFRGAYHNPYMYLPVTIPPLAAAALLADAAWPRRRHRPVLRALLQSVCVLGVVGTGFHALGVARNMGGWANWRQTALQGPPTPAPIGFTGLGMSGLAALDLLDSEGVSR